MDDVTGQPQEDILYGVSERDIVRREPSPGQAVWTLDESAAGQRRVLRPSGLVGFDEYQPRAWEEVKELFDCSRLSNPETANGPGSTIALTLGICKWLPGLFEQYGIKTMLDAPCGDINWLRTVDLGHIAYIGWDVVLALVEQCSQRVADGDCAGTPNAVFECVNLLTVSEVPQVDLILSRDFLAHLPNEPAQRVLDKFKASGSRYLLTSHYPHADNVFVYDPKDFAWIGYAERPINLEAGPFLLGAPLEAYPEMPGPHGVISQPHELALFDLRGQ